MMVNFGTLLDLYNTRLHVKIQNASHKNQTSMPISILLEKLENLETFQFYKGRPPKIKEKA